VASFQNGFKYVPHCPEISIHIMNVKKISFCEDSPSATRESTTHLPDVDRVETSVNQAQIRHSQKTIPTRKPRNCSTTRIAREKLAPRRLEHAPLARRISIV
jgi:hypothetical protein